MQPPKYYGPNFDRVGDHLSVAGAMEQRVDELHLNFAMNIGKPLSGTVAQQSSRAVVKAYLFALGVAWLRQFPDALRPGQTADGLAWYFWHQAQALFAFYGR